MLSCIQTQNVIDGKKRIILNPSEAQKRDFDTVTFAEGDVYGMDVLISSGEDGKVCKIFNHATTSTDQQPPRHVRKSLVQRFISVIQL